MLRVLREREAEAEDIAAFSVAEGLMLRPKPVDHDRAYVLMTAYHKALDRIEAEGKVEGYTPEELDRILSEASVAGCIPPEWQALFVDADSSDESSNLFDDSRLESLRAASRRLEIAIRLYVREGTEPSKKDIRARIALWLFPFADPLRAFKKSTELARDFQGKTGKSLAAVWRDRRDARDVGWPWVRRIVGEIRDGEVQQDLLEKYCRWIETRLNEDETAQ